MGGFSPSRTVRSATRGLWRTINRLGDRVECRLGDAGSRPLSYPPIFMLGAPRSGSTLAAQVITQAFDVGYLTNLHCACFGAPSLVERTTRTRRRRHKAAYTSRFGRTEGWLAPSECGRFWYRFFRRHPHYVGLDDIQQKDLDRFRSAIRALVDSSGGPFFFKNLYCGLRLQPVAAALPEALFVVMHRDEIDTAQSILATRKALHDDYETWWSMEPPGVEAIKRRPSHEQALEQVRHIYALLEDERASIGQHRFLDVRYEALCEDTGAVLAGLERFLESHGLEMARRGEVPASFDRKPGLKIARSLHDQLVRYARENPRPR